MVDDGATDSSAPIAAAFAERDDRFQLVRQPNGGLGNARNTGADRATGDYIAFVDSDDVVVRNAYELLVGSLEATGSDFASGNYHRLTTTGTRQAGMVTSAFTATRLAHPRLQAPGAAQRPHRVEQGVPPLVLGPTTASAGPRASSTRTSR